MNKLYNTRVYLIGGMDRVTDGGTQWRNRLKPFLSSLGIVVLDPCDKPIDSGAESDLARQCVQKYKDNEDWNAVAKEMKLIRCVDLRMVDISDFVIVYLNLDNHPFGTVEELTTANRQKKPVLVVSEGSKKNAPNWLFGMIPHQHIFSSFDELQNYLKGVDSGEDAKHYKRWFFFDQGKLNVASI